MYDFSTFDNFITTTVGETIGEGECWDYINLIWNHLGTKYWTYPPDDPTSTNHGVKWGWILEDVRTLNTIEHLTQIPNLNDVKRGDIIIISNGTFGHAGYAGENYNGSGSLWIYSQNWQGHYVTYDLISMSSFLGAWRYDAWNNIPPTPSTIQKSNFKWVLYARKLRDKRNGM